MCKKKSYNNSDTLLGTGSNEVGNSDSYREVDIGTNN